MAYHLEQNEDTVKPMGNYRIISTQRALCNSLVFMKETHNWVTFIMVMLR